MYLKLTPEEIFSSTSVAQLAIKRKYLVDTLLNTSNLSNLERFEINHLILLIDYRMEDVHISA